MVRIALWKKNLLPAALFALFSMLPLSAQEAEQIQINATATSTPFPHFWEEMFGSGRAALSLRESYRSDLRAVKSVTDFKYVRFHAILHDELGVYNEDEHGEPIYNWSYVDQIYDGLLKNGVKPVVEISFMPKKLAFNPDALHPFWYKQNVSPPKSMKRWDDLISAMTRHLVERYGLDEVAAWYFEVWNEPNIDFWGGIPRKESYFDLYAHTARDVKSVSPRLRVGGPATAAAAWIPDFLKFCADNSVPVDFVSTHGYADEPASRLLGKDIPIAPEEIMSAVIEKVRDEIDHSPSPHLPLLWTEWNVVSEKDARETPYVGPAVANVIRESDGKVQYLSFWTFSEVFEEGGPPQAPFQHFGLRAVGGINKPAFYDFALLHQLGTQRIANDSKNAIVTKLADGSLAIVVWNLVPPTSTPHSTTMTLHFEGLSPKARTTVQRVDEEHGNVTPFYKALGSPVSPTEAQVKELNEKSEPSSPEEISLKNNSLTLTLGPNALVLLHVK